MSIHRTEMYTEIWKCKPLGRIWMDSTHKKSCNEDTFLKCGQTHLLTKHTAYEIKTIQVAHKDIFFKTPAHFGEVQGIKMSKEDALKIRKWRNFLWERWKGE